MNRLKEIIEKLKAIDEPFRGATFYPPATDEEIRAFEAEHNLTIPESYKKWLRLTNGARLEGGIVLMYGVDTPKLPSVNEASIFYDNSGNILEDKEKSDYIILAEWSSFSFIGCRKDNGKLVFLSYSDLSNGTPELKTYDELSDLLEFWLEFPED